MKNDEIKCGKAVTSIEIQTVDVPDSQNNNQICLDELKTNAKRNASNNNTTDDIDTAHKNDAGVGSGDDDELRQKLWHRRLHTPVWARCSKHKSIF